MAQPERFETLALGGGNGGMFLSRSSSLAGPRRGLPYQNSTSSVNLGGTRFLGGRYDQEKFSAPDIADRNCTYRNRVWPCSNRTTPKPHEITSLPPRTRYLPEYTASGDLILPKNNIA